MDIYKILGNSYSMYNKSIRLEYQKTLYYLEHTLAVVLNGHFFIMTGSTGEGTDITPGDYHRSIRRSVPSSFFSDIDVMSVLYQIRVMGEGEALPQEFDNHIYCRAERGKHTTDGYRKLRIIHNPEHYSFSENTQCADMINHSTEDGYISSERFVAELARTSYGNPPWKHNLQKGKNCKLQFNTIYVPIYRIA